MKDAVTIPAASEPVEVSWLKTHTRVPSSVSAWDTIIGSQYLPAAREQVENDTGRLMMQQSRTLYLDDFQRVLEISRSPVRSLVAIRYLDQDGALQTIDLSTVRTDADGDRYRIVKDDDTLWPITDDVPSAVRVEYRAGYAAALSADNASNTFTASNHDLQDGDSVILTSYGGTLPSGLTHGPYFVISRTDDTFQAARSPDGAPVEISDDGTGPMLAISSVGFGYINRMVQALAMLVAHYFENASAVTVGNMPSVVPIGYESLVDGLNCQSF